MDNKTFDKLQRMFGKSYGFEGSEYWNPNQKEYKKLKEDIEQLLGENKGLITD